MILEQKYFFSLMWPDYTAGRQIEAEIRSGHLSLFNQDLLERDVNAEMLLEGMEIRNENKNYIKMRLMDMVLDDKIIKYRQDILKDFMKYPDIEQAFDQTLLPMILRLREMKKANIAHDDNIRKIAWRIEMLKMYMQCVDILHGLICAPDKTFLSEGMKELKHMLEELYEGDGYRELKKLLPDLYDKLQTMKGITIGINLDNELRPENHRLTLQIHKGCINFCQFIIIKLRSANQIRKRDVVDYYFTFTDLDASMFYEGCVITGKFTTYVGIMPMSATGYLKLTGIE